MPLPEELVDLVLARIAEHTPPGVWFSRQGKRLSFSRTRSAASASEARIFWVPRRLRPRADVWALVDGVADLVTDAGSWPTEGAEPRVSLRDGEVRIRFVADGGTVLRLTPIRWAGPWSVETRVRRASKTERFFGDVPAGYAEESAARAEKTRRRMAALAASPEAVALKRALDDGVDPVVMRERLRAAHRRAGLKVAADGRLEDLEVDLATAGDHRLPRLRATLLMARGLVRMVFWLRANRHRVLEGVEEDSMLLPDEEERELMRSRHRTATTRRTDPS